MEESVKQGGGTGLVGRAPHRRGHCGAPCSEDFLLCLFLVWGFGERGVNAKRCPPIHEASRLVFMLCASHTIADPIGGAANPPLSQRCFRWFLALHEFHQLFPGLLLGKEGLPVRLFLVGDYLVLIEQFVCK